MEKVQAFHKVTELPERIRKICLSKLSSGLSNNMVHTDHGLYKIDESDIPPQNLITDSYEIPEVGHVQSTTFYDDYIFVSLGEDIYYWDGDPQSTARKLEGTYVPDDWEESTQYNEGDIVKPTNLNYSGYIYKCIRSGESGATEPTWEKDLSTVIDDGTAKWVGCGSLELEGVSASSLRAQCIENYKGFLFAANLEEDGQLFSYRLRWSQWQNPRMWHNNEDGSGLSGYVDVNDTEGRIVAIKKLGDTLFIYKERSIIGLTYTGGEDTTFSKEVVTTVAGLISPDAIVELPHMHIFIGQDNIYAFDGNTCTPIGDSIKQWVLENIRPEKLDSIFGYYNEDSGDITFSFCSTTYNGNDCDKAIIYNTGQRVWSTREMYMTAIGRYCSPKDKIIDSVNMPMDEVNNTMIDSAIYLKDKILTMMGDEDGNLYLLDGYVDSRRDYEGYAITKTHHMDAPDRIKRLLRIQFHIETQGDYNMYCQVGTAWNAEQSILDWTDKLYMNLEKPNPWYSHHIAPFVDVDLSARYFQIRFGTEKNSQPFKILGYTLFYQLRSDE